MSFETISSLKEENLSKNIIKQVQTDINKKFKKSKINTNYVYPRKINKTSSLNKSLESLKNIKYYDLNDQNISKNKKKYIKHSDKEVNIILRSLLKEINNNKNILTTKHSINYKILKTIYNKVEQRSRSIKKNNIINSFNNSKNFKIRNEYNFNLFNNSNHKNNNTNTSNISNSNKLKLLIKQRNNLINKLKI